MQNNDEQAKPASNPVADEFASVRRSAVWGQADDRPHILNLPLEQIKTNPNQPRKHFDQTELEELAASIARVGLMQPIVVRRQDDGTYLVVAGERRFRAHEHLGRPTIPAIVTSGNPDELAVIENIQRVNLSPLEEAEAYKRLMEQYGYKQEELGAIVHKDQTNISMTLRLNDLPESIRKDEASHKVPKSILLEVAREADRKKQRALWKDIKHELAAGMPVTVRSVRAKREARKESQEASTAPSPDRLVLLGQSLSKQLETISVKNLAGNTVHQETLRALKRRLDELFAQLEEYQPPAADEAAEPQRAEGHAA